MSDHLGFLLSPRWRHDMGLFVALMVLVEGNPSDSPHLGPLMRDFVFSVSLNKLLNTQSSYQYFKTWRLYCDVTIMAVPGWSPSWNPSWNPGAPWWSPLLARSPPVTLPTPPAAASWEGGSPGCSILPGLKQPQESWEAGESLIPCSEWRELRLYQILWAACWFYAGGHTPCGLVHRTSLIRQRSGGVAVLLVVWCGKSFLDYLYFFPFANYFT